MASTPGTREKAVAGVTSRLIGPGEEVTWEATHFGIRQRLTSRDSQVKGAFRRFDHDHFFSGGDGGGTPVVMREVFDYEAPPGPLGRMADRCFLRDYMERFLRRRADWIREAAEAAQRQKDSGPSIAKQWKA